MKILLVAHYFLPRHQAGTEIYTGLLARALAGRGHQISILASEDGGTGIMPVTSGHGLEGHATRFKLVEESWEGLPVFRLHRGEPPVFERSYTDPAVDAIFRQLLTRLKPDVVHFQHTFRLSAGMIPACKDAGIPAALTLADFWFICPPILLLQPGLSPCPGPDLDRCARCGNAIGALYAGGTAGTGGARERLVRAAHALKRRLPRPLVERARAWKQQRELQDSGSEFQRRRALLAARQETMRLALDASGIVIAPSEYLRQKMIAAGMVEPERIIHSDYGFDVSRFSGLKREPADHLRFGFIGTPVEHKGAHVAVAAMNRLRDTAAELWVYGDLSWFPAYARRLRRLAKNPRVCFPGRFENAEAGRILSRIDALIVPSLWPENSPLTIHEAFLAGVPVLVSDLGGMAELVQPGGGLAFRPGDEADLARAMRGLLERPEELERLRRSIPPVKSIADNAEELEAVYRRLRP
jgi:glycosyltransferase involved in cell wall biosynthesis